MNAREPAAVAGRADERQASAGTAGDGRIRCVVVNYNAGAFLSRCVADLLAQTLPVEVVVVDNASRDASLAEMPAPAEPSLEVIRNPDNRGFAAACNQGAQGAAGDYLAFVNPDCRLPAAALAGLQAALSAEPDGALAGAWVCDLDGSEQRGTRRTLPDPRRALMTFSGLERWSSRWPTLAGVNLQGPPPETTQAVAAVNGACFLVRRDRFEQLGGFDEGFFLHCEDLDLFKRIRDAGWRVLLVPGVKVTHAGGVPSAGAPFSAHWHKHQSMARYWRKHYPRHPARLLGLAGLWMRFAAALPMLGWRRLFGRRP